MSQAPSGVRGWPSARTVGGGVSAGLGRGTLELDFRVSATPPPSDLDTRLDSRLSSMHLADRRVLLTAADVSAFCGSPFDDTDPGRERA